MPLTGIVTAGLMTAYVIDRGTDGTAGPFFISHPNAETPITRVLKSEISLKSERQFRARVADFMGRSLPEINEFQVWNFLRHFALNETGNMHGGAGFWQDAIPTLVEYNQLMTPGYFAFMRSFFTRPPRAESVAPSHWSGANQERLSRDQENHIAAPVSSTDRF
jgi:hypothetical protein